MTVCHLGARQAKQAIKTPLHFIHKHADALRQQDPDAIHEVRVASRRLRTALTEYGIYFEKDGVKKLKALARKITRTLGEPRQLDVTRTFFEARIRQTKTSEKKILLEIQRVIQEHRESFNNAIEKITDQITSDEFKKLSQKTLKTCHCDGTCILSRATKRTLRQYQTLVHSYPHHFESDQTTQLHQFRIALKKFRYTCETYRYLYDENIIPLMTTLKQIQESLGAWHDLAVMRDYLATIVIPTEKNALRKDFEALNQELFQQQQTALTKIRQETADFFTKRNQDKLLRVLLDK